MGKVNVVLPSGRVVAVDEDIAAQAQGDLVHQESGPEAATREAEAERRASYEDHPVAAALEGAADTLTLGGFGKAAQGVAQIFDPYGAQKVQQQMGGIAEYNPGARTAGEIGAFFVPGAELAAPGLAGKAGKYVEEGALAGRARPLTAGAEALGVGADRVTEGAILGAGAHVAQSNITGDPLSIEGAIEDAGIGAILGVGIGALGDKLRGAGYRARAAAVEEQQLASDLVTANKGADTFAEPPPSWDDFRQSHEAAVKTSQQLNREIAREADKYQEFLSTSKLGTAANKTQDVINELQNERYAARGANVQFVEGKPRGVLYGAEGNQILTPSQPPLSEDLAARFKAYQQRMSRIYKLQAGGWDLEEGGKWVKAPSTPPDPRRALEELRAIQTDLKAEFPKAANGLGKYGDLPEMPREPVPVSDVKVPATLREFARMRPDTISKLAADLDPASQASFGRLANDLGLETTANAAETVAGVHKTLGEYISTIDRLKTLAEKEAAKEAKQGLLLRGLKWATRAAGGTAGFKFGGYFGSLVGRSAGSWAGEAMIAGKQGLTSKIRQLVAKWGEPAAKAAEKLRPVMSYLGASFPDGKKDSETDVRVQAANRIGELRAMGLTVNDTAYAAVQGLLGAPGDAAFKVHQHVVNAVNHLTQVAPQDPGLDTTMFGSNWTPAYHDTLALAHRLEAVQAPLSAIARSLSGDSHPAATETLWATWPALMNELSAEVSSRADDLRGLTYEQTAAYSDLFRAPMSGLQEPIVITTLQGLYLPQPSEGGGAQPASRGTGRPTGRPPAVQSPVAGSDVSALIS